MAAPPLVNCAGTFANLHLPTMSKPLPQLRVAVVGATGMVGRTMLKVLEKRAFPVGTLIPVASARSVGKKVEFAGSTSRWSTWTPPFR